MNRRILLAVAPVALALPFLANTLRREPPRVVASNHAETEQKLGYRLLAPSVLPPGMMPGENGVKQGAKRVLCAYESPEHVLIVAQEARSPERDAYNREQFAGRAVTVNGSKGSLTWGSMGERRLVLFTPESTVILSSASMSEEQLLDAARSMR